MRDIKVSRVSKLPLEIIFGILKDVAEYPNFLSWCSEIKILSSKKISADKEVLQAEMTMNLAFVQAKGLSEVTIDYPNNSVVAKHTSGPLVGSTISWILKPENENTRICFEAKIGVPFFAVGLANKFATQIVNTSIIAFENKAKEYHKNNFENISSQPG